MKAVIMGLEEGCSQKTISLAFKKQNKKVLKIQLSMISLERQERPLFFSNCNKKKSMTINKVQLNQVLISKEPVFRLIATKTLKTVLQIKIVLESRRCR